ncbi:MAG TPA: hypothetical protein VIY73_11730 [Polyangiaceae bacterium]
MMNAPQNQAMVQAAPSGMAAIWHAHDVVSCRRKVLAIAPTFEIFDGAGNPIVFCQEKLFKIKDDIRIYADGSKQVELLRIKQRNMMDWAGLFDVFDPQSGAKLGAFRRKGWRSWLRDEWHILDANDTQVGAILETGTTWLRRVFKFLPYTFAFNLGGQQVGAFDQHFAFIGYKATMNIAGWKGTPYDRRLAFAGALLLMAVEAKEDASR